MRPFQLTTLLLLLAPTATAHQTRSITSGNAYTRVQTGDVDGDGLPDVAYREGSNLEVLVSPAVYDLKMPNVIACLDFTVVRTSVRDSFLVSTSGGLKEVALDVEDVDANEAWLVTDADEGWDASDQAAWTGVRNLATWSAAPGDRPHVFATDAAGEDDVLWLEPVPGDWVRRQVTIPSPATITQLVAFEYDTDIAGPEIAVVRSKELVILAPATSQVLATYSIAPFSSTALQRIGPMPDGGSREWLGWLFTTAASVQYFCMVGEAEGAFHLANLGSADQFRGFAVGDCDGDGTDDMVYSSTATWNLTWVMNQGTSAPNYAGSNGSLIVVDGPGVQGEESTNMADPVVADLDGDGDGDVAYPIRSEGEMWLRMEETAGQQGRSSIHLFDVSITQAVIIEDCGATAVTGRQLTFGVEVDEQTPGNYIEIAAWRRVSPASALTSPALHRERVQISEGSNGVVHIPPFVVETEAIAGPLGPGAVFNSMVYLSIRPVDATSSDPRVPPTTAYPATCVRLHASGNGSDFDDLLLEVPNEGLFQVVHFPGVGGGDDVGAGESIPFIPLPPSQPPG